MTDRHLDHARENVRANSKLSPVVHLVELEWGISASSFSDDTDLVLGADLIYPNNAHSDMLALTATIQSMRRPTLLAYVERAAEVTSQLELTLASLSCRPRCQRTRLGAKTYLYLLDNWAPHHTCTHDKPSASVADGATPACRRVEKVDDLWLDGLPQRS